ncbi:SDR family NAD(P)-dependent oxidoreductase [Bosea sp. NPDC055594]
MSRELSGKRALVTGAASGIGRASAQALQAAGANVVGLDRAAPGDLPFAIERADLRNEEEIIAGTAHAAERLGGIDILVNAAGIMREAPLAAVSAADIDLHLSVNLRGLILVTREALKWLGTGGRIVNLSSELATLGRQNASVYVATKAAVIGLTRSWARELAPGLLVNAVAPGPTDTPLLGFDQMTPEQQALELAHPLARLGQPEEIAAAVVFLCGPGASFMTGHCLSVNGGAAMT